MYLYFQYSSIQTAAAHPDLQFAVLLLAARGQRVQRHRGLGLELGRAVLHHHVHDAPAVHVGVEGGAPRWVHGGLLLLVHRTLLWMGRRWRAMKQSSNKVDLYSHIRPLLVLNGNDRKQK